MPHRSPRAAHWAVAAALALAACEDSVAPVQQGVTPLAQGSTLDVVATYGGFQTFRLTGTPGVGLYFVVSAQDAPASVFVGNPGQLLHGLSLEVDPATGDTVLRSATIPVPASGELQVVVGVTRPLGPNAHVRLRSVVDTSFNAGLGLGRIVPGVVYGMGPAECPNFGYFDLTTDTLVAFSARANDLANVKFDMHRWLASTPPVFTFFSGIPWAPVAGIPNSELDLGFATATPAPGRYAAALCTGGFPGRFRMKVLSERPEHVASVVTVGDTLTGESLDAVGDIDDFTMTATPGDSIFFAIAGGDAASSRFLFTFTPGDQYGRYPISGGNGSPLLANVSPVEIVPPSGQYKLRVAGTGPWFNRGPYRIVALPAPRSAPEIAAPTLNVGDSVVTETLWSSLDTDWFTLNVAANQQFTVEIRKVVDVGATSQLYLVANGACAVQVTVEPTGRLRCTYTNGPAASQIRLEVTSPNRQYLGRYELRVYPGFVP